MSKDDLKVFLSHSSRDKELAANLAKDLIQRGIDVWIDVWEMNPGDSLLKKIENEIMQATHFMVLLTPHSLESEWVQKEIEIALKDTIIGQCRIIPVLYDIDYKDVPEVLRDFVQVNLRNYKKGLKALVDGFLLPIPF
jgi:hypothetical protein